MTGVAVVGVSFRFPGADTPEEFWRNTRDGLCHIRRFTDAELAAAGVPEERRARPDFVGASGTLTGVAGFDAEFFRMSAREATVTDPQNRLFLECAYHALEDAGRPREDTRTRIGVYASTGYHLYSLQNYLLNNVLPDAVADDWLSRLEITIGGYADFTATRTAFRLGLTGPAVNVQSACSSSLVAVQLAAQSVLAGDCDLALAGATAVHVPQVLGYHYVKGSILSKTGRLRPFDAAADGTVGGTGVAAIVLKRLDRALADGDRIHGVIRGWGVTNDGATKPTYAGPSAEGQRAAIRRALDTAGVGADRIGYVEMHGTGTLKGDPIEFEGATAAFREDTGRTGYCAIGAGKANIGHLDVCGGLAGLIRTLLVLEHGVIPPVAGFGEANPALDLAGSPFYIPEAARPWPRGEGPRLAGLTSLGLGGTNVHMILEEAPAPAPRSGSASAPGVVLVSGRDDAALTANARALRDHLRRHPDVAQADLATTTILGRAHLRHRLAVQGDGPEAVAGALDEWLNGREKASNTTGVLAPGPHRPASAAFLFTGQGSPYPGMLSALHERFEVVRDVLREGGSYGVPLTVLLGDDTSTVQPALFLLQCAITELWRAAGVRPGAVAGHSLGEYAALYAAGALSLEDGVRLTTARERLMRRCCPPGAMVAVPVDRAAAERFAAQVDGIELAVVNARDRQVLAGPPGAVDRLCALLERDGVRARRMDVERAFHTAAMEPMLEEYRSVLDEVTFLPTTLPFVSGLDGAVKPAGWAPDTAYLLRHVREPVRFDEVLRALADRPVLLEVGPHTTLTTLARRELPGVPAVSTLRRGSGLGQLWAAAGALHCAGAEPGWEFLLAGGDGRRIRLPGYRFQHKTYWTGPEQPALTTPNTPEMESTMASADRVLRRVIELTARHLGFAEDQITADTSFFDLGADSLQTINVLRELEQEYRVKVAMRELFEEAGTPGLLARLITERADLAVVPMHGPATFAPSEPAAVEPAAVERPRRRRAVPLRAPAAHAPRARPGDGRPRDAPGGGGAGPPGAPALPDPAAHDVPARPAARRADGGAAPHRRERARQVSGLDALSSAVDRDLAAMAELSETIARRLDEPAPERPQVHGPRVTVSRSSGMVADGGADSQRAHLDDLVRRYTAKTRTSKELTQRYRRVLADSRAVVGFRSSTKEMQYPIAGRRAKGSWLEDVDGNRYVDITMGFGVLLFGHEPEFVASAVREHLSRGIQLGPRAVETGEAAELLAGLTGMERVAFANSGTEANSAALRLARAATGRNLVVTFHGSYHGHADNVLGRASGEDRLTVPVSTGVPPGAVADLMVLDYGDDASLEAIERHAAGIAAVVVEPVQSRNPALRPVEFVRRLREVTRKHGIVLMFDEMLTGFRPALRGAQELYGVSPDLATYGKLLGGGFPIGAIAGRADIMDGVDGGFWQYGDDGYPPADTTFFGGTYIQHPVSMVAAKAVLTHLKEQGPGLQQRLNARTDELAATLNGFFEAEEFPLRIRHFGSMFRFEHRADMELLYHHLMLRGVHVWEWRNFFLSTEHSDGDLEFVADAVRGSMRDLRQAGFFGGERAAPVPKPVRPPTVERIPAMAWNTAATRETAPAPPKPPERPAPDFSVYFFGDYPREEERDGGRYDVLLETARFADEHGFHALWMPERHFHSFGGLFPNPAVLASALARETSRIRLNAGSVVMPLHDPVRVAEEWSMVDNLSGGRVGIGCASGWNAGDFVFFPERFGRHKELMYEQVEQVRSLWRGEAVRRLTGDGEREVRLFPKPVQGLPPMYTAVVGNPASYELAAEHDLGIVTNLMAQSVEKLAENIALYRRTRAAHGLDPDAGRVAVMLHTYVGPDDETARAEAFEPLSRYMRSSLSIFGSVTNSLGYNVDLDALSEDDLDVLFRRAYDRYCDSRALIGSAATAASVVDAVRAAGADEVIALVDFGVEPSALRGGLTHLDTLRRRYHPDVSEPETTAPLSAGQRRIWVFERTFPGQRAHNEIQAVRLDGPVDVPSLRTALDRLVARHGQLRTVFREAGGEPRQVTLAPGEADFAVLDRTGADEAPAVRAVVAEESARAFDLENGPLLAVRLVRLGAERHVLVLSMHHIVMDAVSAGVIARDLSALYRSVRDGAAPDLPALTRTYADLAAERAGDDPDKASEDLAYWRRTLGGEPPTLEPPCDRPRPGLMSFEGRGIFRTLDATLSDRLRALSRERRGTLFMTLLAAYGAMLHDVTGQDDIVVGTPMSTRPRGAEDVVGFFLNPLALRLDVSGDPAFGELLDRVRAVALDAYDHAGAPFETVVRAVARRRGTDRTPIFQAYAEFAAEEPIGFDLPGVRATVLDEGPDRAVTDLTMAFVDRPGGIRCHLSYNSDLFDAGTAEGFLDRFHAILDAAARAPETPLSCLTREEEPADGPVVPIEDTTVHALVERQAAAAPERTAIVCGDAVVTYGELDERAGRLAAAIRERVGEPPRDGLIALWLPRSPELIVAMLAALKAGYGYMALDPGLGRARAKSVIAECGADALVRSGDGLDPGIPVIDAAETSEAAYAPTASPPSPCYVVHTSGSTGRPKGIAIGHRAVVNMCAWHHRRFGFTPADRSSVVCTQSFDGSVFEIWPALTSGASLAIAGEATRLDPAALARWYASAGVTFSFLPTALGEAIMTLPDAPPLRFLAVGGDALRTRPRAGAPYEVVNIYGPSEVTVLCTETAVGPEGGPVPLGRPIDNVRLRVLDRDGRPARSGELYVGGAGLAEGYRRLPEQTARRFVTGSSGERLYRTGDLVRWNDRGELEFRGRIDDQVKIRGFRVEPEEVTHHLAGLDGVREAVVTSRRTGSGEGYLAAFVVPYGTGEARQAVADRLAAALAERLPEYLVPRAWAVLDSLPLGAHGKLDRAALPETPIVTALSAPLAAPAVPEGDVAPEVERRLRELWSEEFTVDPYAIGAETSFFDLGGHSISAIRLVNRIREVFGADYPLTVFYQRPTLRAMAAYLGDAVPAAASPEALPERVEGVL